MKVVPNRISNFTFLACSQVPVKVLDCYLADIVIQKLELASLSRDKSLSRDFDVSDIVRGYTSSWKTSVHPIFSQFYSFPHRVSTSNIITAMPLSMSDSNVMVFDIYIIGVLRFFDKYKSWCRFCLDVYDELDVQTTSRVECVNVYK